MSLDTLFVIWGTRWKTQATTFVWFKDNLWGLFLTSHVPVSGLLCRIYIFAGLRHQVIVKINNDDNPDEASASDDVNLASM